MQIALSTQPFHSLKQVFLTAALLWTGVATAAVDTNSAAAKLSDLLNQMNSMQAAFTQTTQPTKKNKIPVKISRGLRSNIASQTFTGSMIVKRPGLFRWETQSPMNQLIIGNGKTIWIYDQDLMQATRQTVDAQVANTPALLLSGQTDQIIKNFKITQTAAGNSFTLRPLSKDSVFESLQLDFESDKLSKLILADALGQKTSISFSQSKLNGSIADSQFKFTPPKGVDIIDQ